MIIPYMSFQGNCEEAMNLYAEILGGKVVHMSRVSEATGSAAMLGKVMHAQVDFEGGAICASDQEEPVENTDCVTLLIHCETKDEANRIFDAFAVAGQPIQRLTPHPPPDDAGMGALVRDKFGYMWILTAPNK